LLSKPKFRENIQSDSCALFKVLNGLLSYFSQFLPDFSEIVGEYIWCDIFINSTWVVTRWQYTFTHIQYI